jgi:hypothetical protein
MKKRKNPFGAVNQSPEMLDLRERLKKYGRYGPHYRKRKLEGYWWEPLDVDGMSDQQVLEFAETIAKQKPRWKNQ